MRTERCAKGTVLAILLGLMLPARVASGEGFFGNVSEISGSVLAGAHGIAGLNLAAGDSNAQANLWVLGVGGEGPVSVLLQRTMATSRPGYSKDIIGGEAFRGFRGILSVNQSSGSGTSQANEVLIGLNTEGLPTGVLAQAVASPWGSPDGTGVRLDLIEGYAFEGILGIAQVNQSAGVSNAISNSIIINVNKNF